MKQILKFPINIDIIKVKKYTTHENNHTQKVLILCFHPLLCTSSRPKRTLQKFNKYDLIVIPYIF
jgi:hypothetical protein